MIDQSSAILLFHLPAVCKDPALETAGNGKTVWNGRHDYSKLVILNHLVVGLYTKNTDGSRPA